MLPTGNEFIKCGPNISNDIARCGTVTACTPKSITEDELTDVYMKSDEYRIMESLLHFDFEGRMCGTVQNGLWDFFMSQSVNLSAKQNTRKLNSGLLEVEPFILMKQMDPINDNFWEVANGQDAGGGNWSFTVTSAEGVPLSTNLFHVGERIYVDGLTEGGTSTKTAWSVVSRTLLAGVLTIVVSPQNSASNLAAARLTSPVTGLLFRGTANVNDYEQWCNEPPNYLQWRRVPFWVETTRTSYCRSELYEKYRKLLADNNPLFKNWADLDDIELNRQFAQDFQKRMVNNIFWSKPLPNQTMTTFDELETITTYDGGDLGVDGAKCIGRRANVVGIYEQLAECGRVIDLQGDALNLPALFKALYVLMRLRKSNGHPKPMIFDIFTDSVTANRFNRSMIDYYDAESGGRLRLNKSVDREVKEAEFGFNYESYRLHWPQGVVINIVTHDYFDDYQAASEAAGQGNVGRVLWILDFTSIRPGIIASNRVVNKTGDLKTLAAVDSSFACVMKVPSQEQTLTSVTYTVIVECPAGNLILENFSSADPATTDDGTEYITTTTSTTSTTTAA